MLPKHSPCMEVLGITLVCVCTWLSPYQASLEKQVHKKTNTLFCKEEN